MFFYYLQRFFIRLLNCANMLVMLIVLNYLNFLVAKSLYIDEAILKIAPSFLSKLNIYAFKKHSLKNLSIITLFMFLKLEIKI